MLTEQCSSSASEKAIQRLIHVDANTRLDLVCVLKFPFTGEKCLSNTCNTIQHESKTNTTGAKSPIKFKCSTANSSNQIDSTIK